MQQRLPIITSDARSVVEAIKAITALGYEVKKKA